MSNVIDLSTYRKKKRISFTIETEQGTLYVNLKIK